MAGTKNLDDFKELISPFIQAKISQIKEKSGEDSDDYLALANQYYKNTLEKVNKFKLEIDIKEKETSKIENLLDEINHELLQIKTKILAYNDE